MMLSGSSETVSQESREGRQAMKLTDKNFGIVEETRSISYSYGSLLGLQLCLSLIYDAYRLQPLVTLTV